MVRISRMSNRIPLTGRREFMAAFGAAAIASALPASSAIGRLAPLLQAGARTMPLRQEGPETPVWALEASNLRLARADRQEITFQNGLPIPVVLNWRGISGASAVEPLLSQAAVAPGGNGRFEIPLRHAGTFLCDIRLLGDGAVRPSRPLPLVVTESEPVAVDRDELFLIEDWRLRPDGIAIAPASEAKDTQLAYTVNGLRSPDLTARVNERLRFRFINGCQRSVIGLKLEGQEVRVMALDGYPAEPFVARNGAFLVPPGGRVDAFVDVTSPPGSTTSILLHDGREARTVARLITSNDPPTRDKVLPAPPPLPENGLPPRLELKNALRFDLPFGGEQKDWLRPASFAVSTAPAFRAKAGRVVVLSLINRAEIATVFHLHGHHFRLLDRLDDGWKPFWLDTLAIDAGQTQRIAFAAEFAGRWLIESVAADWAAPRLLKWYSVE
jgi:FtsP/CotA-like multicopper oxidase with cupredoxin domain